MTHEVSAGRIGTIGEDLLVPLLGVDPAHASLHLVCDGEQSIIRPLPSETGGDDADAAAAADARAVAPAARSWSWRPAPVPAPITAPTPSRCLG
jgi:hypothetical protein